MTDRTTSEGWTKLAPVAAPEGARCSVCSAPIDGINYIWRGYWRPGRFSDWEVEYAHQQCIYSEGTAILPAELKA